MLYTFKSQAASNILMLEAHGRQILALWGRTSEDSLRQGILLAADMPAAIRALEEAIAQDEAAQAQAALEAQEKRGKKRGAKEGKDGNGEGEEGEEEGEEGQEEAPRGNNSPAAVRLRQRVAPLLNMARRSLAAGKDITWGV